MKIAKSFPKGLKTLWEKEKVIIMSYFSVSHSVFERLLQQTRKNKSLFGKRLAGTKKILKDLSEKSNPFSLQ